MRKPNLVKRVSVLTFKAPQVQTPRGKRSDAAALAGLGSVGLKLPLASGGSAISPIQENRCRDLPGACYAVSALASFSCAVLPIWPPKGP